MFEVGQKVKFGRPQREKTLGTIIKVNIAKCKVRQDEERGNHRIGLVWNVPFSLIYALDGEPIKQPAAITVVKEELTDFWIRNHEHELHILDRIFCSLSPENLTCDGETPHYVVIRLKAELERKLKAVTILLDGRILDEAETSECLEKLKKMKDVPDSGFKMAMVCSSLPQAGS